MNFRTLCLGYWKVSAQSVSCLFTPKHLTIELEILLLLYKKLIAILLNLLENAFSSEPQIEINVHCKYKIRLHPSSLKGLLIQI